MSTHEKQTFLATYDWAKNWQDLPWAHDEPTLFLAEICERRKPGRALDIGCGAGTDSVYLARKGWDVTSLDFMPKALKFTQRRAAEAGVSVRPVEADITEWVVRSPSTWFSITAAANMDPVRYPAYRERVLDAIADDGDFVCSLGSPLPDSPRSHGPLRVDREEILEFFAPDCRSGSSPGRNSRTSRTGGWRHVPGVLWLRRNRAHSHPQELIDQVRATFQRNKVDWMPFGRRRRRAVKAKVAATDLWPGWWVRTLGLPTRSQSRGRRCRLKFWAERAGQNPRMVANLSRCHLDRPRGPVRRGAQVRAVRSAHLQAAAVPVGRLSRVATEAAPTGQEAS